MNANQGTRRPGNKGISNCTSEVDVALCRLGSAWVETMHVACSLGSGYETMI